MTKDEIIRMAREAGVYVEDWRYEMGDEQEALKRFSNLIAAHKSEVITAEAYRCGVEAGAAAELRRLHEVNQELLAALKALSDAIRARGTT